MPDRLDLAELERPALIRRARLAESMAEALDAVRESIERDIDIDGISDEELVKRMSFAERAGAPKWKRTLAALMLRGLMREWDAERGSDGGTRSIPSLGGVTGSWSEQPEKGGKE